MEYKDYYKILGVDKGATADQIKKEYRKLARKFHPDVSKDNDAEKKFKEIGEAYEVLKDSEKRKLYDQYGADWKTGKQQEEHQKQYQQKYQQQQQYYGSSGGEADFGFGGGFDGSQGYSDFFENLFGGGGKRGRSARQSYVQKGEDVNASIRIPLTDAFHGTSRRINYSVQSVSPDGRMVESPVNLNVKIPKGIKNGQKIRLSGQGAPGINGGDKGDMYIKVEFENHPFFRVDSADVYVDVPVAPWEAVLGASVNLPEPFGNISVKVPAGSPQGKKLRLKGKGIPAKTPGDLYIVVNIVLPPANDEKSKKVYEEMKALDFNPRANF